MTDHACLDCANTPGCDLLKVSQKKPMLDERKILLRGEGKSCKGFAPQSESEAVVRGGFLDMFPVSEITAVKTLFNRVSESVQDPEIEEEEVEDIPEFREMLWEGITVDEREEQLKYVTDDGQTFEELENGEKRPRGSFPLRNYLIHELEVQPEVVNFWKTPELIAAIIFEEEKRGWIQREATTDTKEKKMPKVMRSLNKKKQAAPETEEEVETNEEEEETSPGPATAKRTPAKAGGLGGKKKTVTKRATSKAIEKSEAADNSGSVDLTPVLDRLQKLEKTNAELSEALIAQRDSFIVATTLLHDAMIQKINQLAEAADIEGVCPEDGIDGECLYTGDDPQTIMAYLDEEGEE